MKQSFGGSTDDFCHLGGALCGVFAAVAFRPTLLQGEKRTRYAEYTIYHGYMCCVLFLQDEKGTRYAEYTTWYICCVLYLQGEKRTRYVLIRTVEHTHVCSFFLLLFPLLFLLLLLLLDLSLGHLLLVGLCLAYVVFRAVIHKDGPG